MNAVMSLPGQREMAMWRIVDPSQFQPAPPRRRDWQARIGVFCLGLLATTGVGAAVWHYEGPDTIVRTRIVVDGGMDNAGRAALSDVVMRLAAAPDRPATLQDGGDTLVVTSQDHDPAIALQRSRTLVDAILNAQAASAPAFAPVEPAKPADGLRAERARLAALADAVDTQTVAVSTSLAALTRDVASASRSDADRAPGRDTLEKGNAALADLQLKRLQLVNKYQDTYPAVLVMDVQIHDLQKFLSDEAHRIETHTATPDPAGALLNGERDRLRTQLAQLDDRRKALAAELTVLDRRLALLPAAAPVQAAPVASSPILVEASTTGFADDDARLAVLPWIAACGLFLSAVAGMLTRRRRPGPALPHGLLLEPVDLGRLSAGHAMTLPAPMGVARAFVPALPGWEPGER